MRPDIVITKTARTLAAFENRKDVVPEDILKAAELTLSHRTREGGFLEPSTPQEIRESLLAKLQQAESEEDSEKPTLDKVKQKKDKGEQPSREEKRKIFPPFGLRKRMSIREKKVGKVKKLRARARKNSGLEDPER
jgi:magnesium chelatase subunit D